jgi:hypothetical protein
MIKALRDHTRELINLLAGVDSILANAASLPDLEAAKALVELSRMAVKVEKLKGRLLGGVPKTAPGAVVSAT